LQIAFASKKHGASTALSRRWIQNVSLGLAAHADAFVRGYGGKRVAKLREDRAQKIQLVHRKPAGQCVGHSGNGCG